MKKLTHSIVLGIILTCSIILANNIKVYAAIDSYDFNEDGIIDIQDVAKVATTYNLKNSDGNWNYKYDLNGDNVIDIFDLVKISKVIGKVPVTGITGDQVVAYAFRYIGTPYVWGGTSPSGFDDSGFMQYVYAHFGIEIGRNTYSQVTNGYEVSREQLQTGDLVFFGSIDAPQHVGMYIGNGQYIHAPKTGDVIKVSSLSSRSDYATARRICN
jgi:hypothetical protein